MIGPDEAFRDALETQRQRFLETVAEIRPRLHRYCARMLGSTLDGEDVVQETLARAFYKLAVVREPREMAPWLFRIAHNACIDELRRRRVRGEEELDEDRGGSTMDEDPVMRGEDVERALRQAVTILPPKERASVLLKDVLGFSLREIAGIVDSTEGGVKAALHRGRGKLARASDESRIEPPSLSDGAKSLLEQYAERFTARDWTGLVELLRADARLEVIGVYDATGHKAFTDRYCFNYGRFDFPWRFRVVELDGEALLAVEKRDGERWDLFSLVRVWVDGDRVRHVRDYLHVPDYLLVDARVNS